MGKIQRIILHTFLLFWIKMKMMKWPMKLFLPLVRKLKLSSQRSFQHFLIKILVTSYNLYHSHFYFETIHVLHFLDAILCIPSNCYTIYFNFQSVLKWILISRNSFYQTCALLHIKQIYMQKFVKVIIRLLLLKKSILYLI